MRPILASVLVPVLASTASAASAQGDAPASVFAGSFAQSIAAVLVFTGLLAVLVKFAWGPILKGLQDREEHIRKSLEQAELAAKQAQSTLAEYQRKLTQAQDDARKLIEQARADAERLAAQIKEQTHNEIQVMKDRAQRDISDATEAAVAEVFNRGATLATAIASRILQRELRPEDQQRLVQESLAELTRQGSAIRN